MLRLLLGMAVRGDRDTALTCASSGLAGGAFGVEGLDVGDGVPGLPGAAAGAGELAAVDELADPAEGDAEEAGGLVGGEVTGAQGLGLHGFSVPEVSDRG